MKEITAKGTREESLGSLKVAIVGRPNVGKSSIFNRLVGRDKSVVDETEGVTRDIVYAWRHFRGIDILFMDTAGYIDEASDDFLEKLLTQTKRAIDEADIILFTVDAREGPTSVDEKLAEELHKTGKPVILLLNKSETHRVKDEEFEDLNYFGFQEVIRTSATQKMNIDEILFSILDLVNAGNAKLRSEKRSSPRLRIGFIGRPNVGKSSLINAILGSEVNLVSEIPGTTRDAIDIAFSYRGKEYLLIDTPGLRRRARIEEDLEKFSAKRSLGTIKFADLLILVIDLQEGVTRQDKRLSGLVDEYNKGLIIVGNKLDLALKTESFKELNNAQRRYELTLSIREALSFVEWAPITFTSAKLRFGISELLQLISEVEAQLNYNFYESSHSQIVSLKELIHNLLISVPLPRGSSGKKMRLLDAKQIDTLPPTFLLYFNDLPEKIPKSLKLYIQRSLRRTLNIPYAPIKILFKKFSASSKQSERRERTWR